jgi:PTS system galactitol-specific IIA component
MKLYRQHFITNQSFKDSHNLLTHVSQLLFSEGYVNSDFETALWQREQEFPTGIEAKLCFAIPHAEMEYVNQSTFVVVVPKEPVNFVNMVDHENQVAARIIIVMALAQKEEHLEFLKKITALFSLVEPLQEMLSQSAEQQYAFFEAYFATGES